MPCAHAHWHVRGTRPQRTHALRQRPRTATARACRQCARLGREAYGGTLLGAPRPRLGLQPRRRRVACRAADMVPLGHDFLKFLAAFVLITPLFKRMNINPILGFLLGGVLLRQTNTFDDPETLAQLSELGVLFLLFEMGLELSTDRLRALKVYAFGLGTVQVFVTSLVFVLFAVPFGASVGTFLLQKLAFADVAISSINSWDEAIVIAVALSLSSSAFVLQLLGDKGQLASKSGSATLGILLLQDLVTVPFLVLLPVLENVTASGSGAGVAAAAASVGGAVATSTGPVGAAVIAALAAGGSVLAGHPMGLPPEAVAESAQQIGSIAEDFLPTALRSLALIGAIALFGRFGLRRVFEAVATTGSGDAFVATCILTVLGTSMATEAAGFGETLGAFVAGVLLAETSFRPQVEAEVKPFKGILLGLFFLCTGAAVDIPTLLHRFPTIALLTVGLISVKFSITSVTARLFGLSEAESVKVGLTLSQGGEFAFVLLALAQELRVLPEDLNALLICVVVLSMALTPLLAELGDKFEAREAQARMAADVESLQYELLDPDDPSGVQQQPRRDFGKDRPVVILGFNEASQVVSNMLQSPLTGEPLPWIAFSFNPEAVRIANEKGLPVFFGDGSNPNTLAAAADAAPPRAFVLTHRSHPQLLEALDNVRTNFPSVPAFALTIDVRRAGDVQARGATAVVTRASAGVALGDAVLRGLMSTSFVDLVFLEQEMQLAVRDAVETASVDAGRRRQNKEGDPDHKEAGILILDTYPRQGNTLKQADSTQRARTAAKLKIIDVDPKHTHPTTEELPKAFTRVSLDDDR